MAQIFGAKMQALRKGNLISTYNKIGNGLVNEDKIEFGELVKYGPATKRYVQVTDINVEPEQIVGVALQDKAAIPHVYPTGVGATYASEGRAIDVLIVGDVVVELSADANLDDVVEGGKVYLGTDGRVSTKSSESEGVIVNHLPMMQFLGTTEVIDNKTLVTVRKRY